MNLDSFVCVFLYNTNTRKFMQMYKEILFLLPPLSCFKMYCHNINWRMLLHVVALLFVVTFLTSSETFKYIILHLKFHQYFLLIWCIYLSWCCQWENDYTWVVCIDVHDKNLMIILIQVVFPKLPDTCITE